MLEDLKNLILPSKEELLHIISETKRLFKEESNILRLVGNVNIIGDIHGQYFDFLQILELADTKYKFVFLGDYVDRGYNSIELFITLMIMKLQRPEDFILLRGNHENRSQTAIYGFKNECLNKYDAYVYWKFCEVFEMMPLGAIIENKYFCIHGGICPNLTVEWLEERDRIEEFAEISYILWGDPSNDNDGFLPSQRGAGYTFGKNALEDFLKEMHFKYLIRSHQLVYKGIQEDFAGKCITVWSAPNYCYKCSNLGAFVVIEEGKHRYVVFEAVKEQYKL